MGEFAIPAWNMEINWRALFRAVGGIRTLIVYGFVLLLALGVLYLDRSGVITNTVRNWGTAGIILAVLLMFVVCLTPIPSEGLLIIYLKVYGVWWGVFYSWFGAVLSTVIIFPVARTYGQAALRRFASQSTFVEIDEWVKRKGSLGLLVARLLPLPGFAVSYVAGILPSIGFWAYVWTAGVSLIPYYVGAALVFLGITSKFTIAIVFGFVALAAFWVVGFSIHRRYRMRK
ncbi:TVP38/TMEM64 family protein [Alicyclobacillus ferrooxydans]|nr:VTT domain-containing protein [Alicyclobacillus ferrooxydans]